MRALSTKLIGHPLMAGARTAAWAAVAGVTAVWTALVVVLHADWAGPEVGESARTALIYGLPALLGAAMVFDERVAAFRPLRPAMAWCGLIVAASFAADRLLADSVTALLVAPALLIGAVAFGSRPAAGMILVLVMGAFYGSLIAFWRFPTEKTVQLVFGGLTLAMLWQAFVVGRDYSVRMTLGLALPLLYGYITVAQLLLGGTGGAAGRGFMTSTWFMLAVPLIALAGWSPEVHEKIAKGAVVVAGLVGAYATYRWMTNISVTEYLEWGGDRYNYVGGKLRLLGSFPTGQDLGGWTAVAIPFCLAMGFALRGRWRLGCFAAAALCLVALAGSQLRIAVVAVALAALTVVLLHEGSRGFEGLRLGATITALIVMAGLGVAAFQITGGTTDEVTHSYESLLRPFDRTDPSVDARLYKWERAFRDLRSHPFGYGIGTANKQSTSQLSNFESIGQFDVDNGFLVVALEQGFAIMVVFGLAIVALTLDLARKALSLTDRIPAGIAIGAAGGLVAFCVLEFALAYQHGPRALIVWVLAGLGLAQFTTLRPGDGEA